MLDFHLTLGGKMQTTANYDKFVFRNDNRTRINSNHVKELQRSIQEKNLLHLQPIIVNNDFEIIDGQHRFLAAKGLGISVPYMKVDEEHPDDIIRLNVARSWLLSDYLNFYARRGNPHYMKLEKFINDKKLSPTVAIQLCAGKGKLSREKFRRGEFQFDDKYASIDFEACKETIRVLKETQPRTHYTDSCRFWAALIKLVLHPSFDAAHWISQVYKLTTRISAKATCDDYLSSFEYVYNYKSRGNKIDLR